MFRSKGFTIGFSILAALNVFLVVVLIIISSGRADDAMNKIVQTTEAKEAKTEETSPTGKIEDETIPSETEAPVVVRVLTQDDPHTLPVLGELIKEQGSFTINESTGFGVVFHKLPVFDSAEAEGNTINYRGTFQVDGKIYVTDSDGEPYLMYHTEDGYFVTGNASYVKYTAKSTMTKEDPDKVAGYISQDGRTEMTIHEEDGNHLIFTLLRNGETILQNAVGTYDSYGSARFEYLTADGAAYGNLSFTYEEGKLSLVTVFLNKEINLSGDKISTMTLTLKP